MSVRYVFGGSVAIAMAVLVACSGFSGADETHAADEAGANDGGAIPTNDASVDVDAGPTAPAFASPLLDAGFFRIEATEVTYGQFLQFKATFGVEAGAPWSACKGKSTLGPRESCPGRISKDSVAVNCVDACDARSYCEAIGRRLCGYTAQVSEWIRACRGPADTPFPYGATAEPMRCNTKESNRGGPAPSSDFPQCVGAVDGLHDMGGNLAEWGNCRQNGADFTCALIGATFAQSTQERDCSTVISSDVGASYDQVGFRCCAD